MVPPPEASTAWGAGGRLGMTSPEGPRLRTPSAAAGSGELGEEVGGKGGKIPPEPSLIWKREGPQHEGGKRLLVCPSQVTSVPKEAGGQQIGILSPSSTLAPFVPWEGRAEAILGPLH